MEVSLILLERENATDGCSVWLPLASEGRRGTGETWASGGQEAVTLPWGEHGSPSAGFLPFLYLSTS